LFVAVLVLAMLLALTVWPAVVRWHSQVQIALRETLAEEPPAAGQSDKHH
jgi:CPA2 family monovalent cation:H+ antiporter-2